MVPRNNGVKPKRQKKRKSRTEVSSDSDSEPEPQRERSTSEAKEDEKGVSVASKPASKAVSSSSSSSSAESSPEPGASKKRKTDADIQTAFTAFYLQQATKEFGDDLDKLRSADDWRDEHLALLVETLKQGTSLFGKEEMRRVVEAGDVEA